MWGGKSLPTALQPPRLGSGETEAASGIKEFPSLSSTHSQELPRKDCTEAAGLELPATSLSTGTKTTGTLKRPTSLSRHASAAGFPLSGAATWTLGRGYRSPLSAASPAEVPGEGPFLEGVEDISTLLADVARFAEGLEKLKEFVLRDGENPLACTVKTGGRRG